MKAIFWFNLYITLDLVWKLWSFVLFSCVVLYFFYIVIYFEMWFIVQPLHIIHSVRVRGACSYRNETTVQTSKLKQVHFKYNLTMHYQNSSCSFKSFCREIFHCHTGHPLKWIYIWIKHGEMWGWSKRMNLYTFHKHFISILHTCYCSLSSASCFSSSSAVFLPSSPCSWINKLKLLWVWSIGLICLGPVSLSSCLRDMFFFFGLSSVQF